MIVFNRGTLIGLNLLIETGGQAWPSSMFGLREKWKNLQKKDEKNITSEVIKRIIPSFSPVNTSSKWSPWRFTSRETSFHQEKAIIVVVSINKEKNSVKLKNIWLFKVRAKKKEIKEQVKGQGLRLTIWNGWNFSDICFN